MRDAHSITRLSLTVRLLATLASACVVVPLLAEPPPPPPSRLLQTPLATCSGNFVAPATVPGLNGKIAFTRYLGGNTEIYVMNADGSGQINLTNNPAVDEWAAWSPDGTRIAWASSRNGGALNLFVMNADGSNVTQLTTTGNAITNPTWSPDGTQIAFARLATANPGIWVINADGSNEHPITPAGANYREPAWSPNGDRIAARLTDLFTMNPNGTNITTVSSISNLGLLSPGWSPNGTHIVFEAYEDYVGSDIWVVNADGSGLLNLTNDAAANYQDPEWSPDGTKIVFARFTGSGTQLFVMTSQGTGATQLTFNSSYDWDPDWQAITTPVPVTLTATDITASSARLRGTVNPNAEAATAWFAWCLDPDSLNTETTHVDLEAASTPQMVEATLTDLSPNTTYYFQMVAEGPTGGPQRGNVFSFSTPEAIDPDVLIQAATSVTSSGATLNASVNPNGSNTTHWFEWALDNPPFAHSTFVEDTGAGTEFVPVSATLTGLMPSTTFYFRVAAQRAGGDIQRSSVLSFTTGPPEPTVTTGSATSVAWSSATLNGLVNPNAVATNYWFEWGTTNPPSTSQTTTETPAGSGSSNVTATANVTGLNGNTTYYFRLAARGPSNQVQRGSVQQLTTPETPLPSAITDPADTITTTSATLRGRVNPNGVSTGSWFQYGTTNPPTNSTSAAVVGSGTTAVNVSAPITGLTPGQLYYFRTVASGPTKNLQYGTTLSFTAELPDPTPVTGTAFNRTGTSAGVAGTVNPNGTAAEYWVEFATTSTPPFGNQTLFGTLPAGPTAVDVTRDITGLLPGTTYYYRYVARRSGSPTRVYGAVASFDTLATEPSPNTGTANGIGPTTATLNGTVNPNSVATSYWFEWGTTNPPPGDAPPAASTTPVTSAGNGASAVPASAVLNALLANTTYYFRLAARGPSNVIQRGTVQQLTTTIVADPSAISVAADTISTTGATLRGRVNPNGVLTSTWFQWGLTDPPTNETSPVALGTGTSEQNVSAGLTGLSPAQRYYFRTVARGPTNQNQYGSTLSFTTEPLDPILQLGSASNVTTTSATLNAAINPNGSPVEYWFEFGPADPPTSSTLTGNLPSGSQAVSVSSQISGLTGASVFFRLAVRKTGGSIVRSNTASASLTRDPIPSSCTPSHITATSARLNGSVNPNGVTTAYWFEWGPVGSPPTLTVELPAGRGTAAVEAFTTITGLTSDTQYSCRLAARGPSAIVVRGTEGLFTTPVLAEPTIATEAADSILATSATLRARVNPRGADTIVWFEWGSALDAMGERTSQQPAGSGGVEQSFSATIADLLPGRTYYFRAVARGPSGVPQFGNPARSFVTGAIEPDVRTEGCSAVLTAGMTLNGSVNPNASASEYWFRVGRTSPPTEFETPRATAATGATFTAVNAVLTALLPNQRYYYRLIAQRSGGPIREGDIRDCQTTARPPEIQTLAATEISVDGAKLNGRINPHNWPTQYWFQWGVSETALTDTPIQAVLSGVTPVDVFSIATGLRPATDYLYRLVAQGTSRVEGAFHRFRTRDDEVTPGRGRVFVTLYWDTNDNGTRDTGEPVVASPESTCDSPDDQIDGDGYLAIRWLGPESGTARAVGCQPGPVAIAGNVAPGNYKFAVVLPQTLGYFTAWRQTEHDPSRREKTVAVSAGETVHLSFGVRRDEGQLLRSTANTIARGIPIVLVHGWCGSADSWNAFEQYFQNTPTVRSRFTLWRFVYSSGARGAVNDLTCDRTAVPDHSAARVQGLGAELRRLVDTHPEFGTSRVIVIGHSLGGLIARSYMQEWAGRSRVEYLLTLATPHHGVSPDALAAAVLSGDYKPGELSAFEWDAYPRDDRGNPWLRCLNGLGDQGCLLPGTGTRASARVATLSKTIAMGTLVNARQLDPLVPLTSSLFSAPSPPLLTDRYTGGCSHRGILDAACRLSKSVAAWASEFSVAPTPGEGSTSVFDLIATILRPVGRRPTNVSARSDAGTAHILWEPPTGGAATELLYQVEGQPRSAGDGRPAEASTEDGWIPLGPRLTTTTHSLSGVPTGTYAIRVLAIHSDGSEPSEAVPLDVGVCIGRPGIPVAVTPTVVGNVVSVTWQPPADGCPPTGYQVSVGSGPGLSNIVNLPWASPPIAGSVTSGVFYLRVRAVNGSFTGDSSAESIIPVGVTPPPQAPTNVTVNTSPGAVSFSWTASPTATGYLLEAGSAPGLSDLTTVPLSAATTHAFTGIPRGRYFVRVRAVNASGPGAASVELEVIVP